LLLFFVEACQKESATPSRQTTLTKSELNFRSIDQTVRDSLLRIFAKTVAAAQASDQFKQFLEAEVKGAEGGTGTILLAEKTGTVIESMQLSELLSYYSAVANVAHSPSFFSDTLVNAIPNLTVSVYPGENNDELLSNWTYTSDLYVMPVTSLFTSGSNETFNTAFDKSGQTTFYSNFEDPDLPVVIVQADPYYVVFDSVTWDMIDGHDAVARMLVDCDELLENIQNLISAILGGRGLGNL